MGLFGRSKRDTSGSVCSECGRSLLAGELTHRIVDDEGNERVICSLCGEPSMEGAEAQVFKGSAAPEGGDTARSDSDKFWRALKEKDAQIEHLEARLARSEAERQELVAQLALLQAQSEQAAQAADASAGLEAEDEATGEHALVAETVAELPYDETTEAAPVEPGETAEAEPAAGVEPGEMAGAPPQTEPFAAEAAAVAAAFAADEAEPAAGEDTASMPAAAASAAEPDEHEAEEDTMAPVAEPDEGVSSLTLLQRGVDILNVSPVPRKVADTSADLGVPQVHVGFDGQTVAVTFLWSLGWYRFSVSIEGAGSVRLDERGYDDRPDLQPNASVRADGTVQLAPAQISKAARGREAAPAPEEETPSGPRTPRDAAERPPEIVSQSLLGQRTDDEKPSWEQTQAREFNW